MFSFFIVLICAAILFFLAGISDGITQTLLFHYSYFDSKHPNHDETFWNPNESWKRKYKADLVTPKFFLSKTVFVFLTDGYHCVRTIERAFNAVAWLIIAVSFNLLFVTLGFYAIPFALALSYICRGIGFHASYSLYYSKSDEND